MPITRSLRRQAVKCESDPAHLACQDGNLAIPHTQPPASIAAVPQQSEKLLRIPPSTPSDKRSMASKKSILRTEALKKLAAARVEEARAATAFAEAELAAIDACSGDDLNSLVDEKIEERSAAVAKWLDTNACAPTTSNQQIDTQALVSALSEAARAMHRPKTLFELPTFGGATSEWLAFKAAFKETSDHFTKLENLVRLRRSLKGAAKEAAISLFIADVEPEEIITLLEARFGRPDALVISEMDKIKSLSRLSDNPRDICIFASKIINIVTVIKALKKECYLYNPESVRTVVEKMTPTLRYRWYDYAAGRPEEEADLLKLSSFFSREADLCSRYAQAENNNQVLSHKKPYQSYLASNSSATPETSGITDRRKSKPQNSECIVCNRLHRITDCHQFTDLEIKERWEKAKELNLCFRCLGPRRNYRHRCSYKPCGIGNCRASHHSLLHFSTSSQDTPCKAQENSIVVAATRQKIGRALLKIVPVTLSGPRGIVSTFALLDEGSSITLIEEEVASEIGLTGPQEPFVIEGVTGVQMEASNSKRVSLYINGAHSDKKHKIEARTISSLNLKHQSVDMDMVKGCEHLIDIIEDIAYDRGTPTLLIGQDNWQIIVSRKIRSGGNQDPVASLTKLGWVLHGPSKGSAKVNVLKLEDVYHEEHENEYKEEIEQLMKQFMSIDSLGINPRRPKGDPDERALSLLEKHSRRLPDGYFETTLLWRREDIELPQNRENALRRLIGIEKKLDKNPEQKIAYNAQIAHLLECGYAEVAPSSSHSSRTWYLPHFAVVNPSKPKPRIVLDAASKTKGISLNDTLLTGPDLLQSLPGVLMRFRQRPIAVSGDIREMFLQIKIRSEDRDALRFLWRGDRREGEPKEYRMTRVIFGAASSPCTAIYIKNRNAEEFRQKYPEAVDAICRNHYMDDYLQSFDSVEDAKRMVKEVTFVHRQAKFDIQKWASNNPEVIVQTESHLQCRSKQVELQTGPLAPLEKTLGLFWRTGVDELTFNLDVRNANLEVLEGMKRPTKREFLKILMSLFDPLGLITPIILPARGILQETWRLGILWDNLFPDDLYEKWLDWLEHMKKLKNLNIPRCYPRFSVAKNLEMHIFVDASEAAYVAAVYWRAVEDENVHISLVMAKGRVAPIKLVSIPRLELQAAVLGCRLARYVELEHDLKPSRRIFWTDSRTVLAWLRSGPRVFKPFVAHRVAEIEEETRVKEWRWVPSADNVADDATRHVPQNFDRSHRWFCGPAFLYSPEEAWPREEVEEPKATGEERVAVVSLCMGNGLINSLPEAIRFSSWMRLIRASGRVLQFIDKCRKKQTIAAVQTKRQCRTGSEDKLWKPNAPRSKVISRNASSFRAKAKGSDTTYITLEPEYIVKAEKLWLMASQQESFANDIIQLQKNLPLKSDSRLRTLNVIIDNEGIMRLKSRIDATLYLTKDQCSPPILDGGSVYARLYITWIHCKNNHAGPETVMNEVRSRFWIIRLRPITRSIVKGCVHCRMLRAKPSQPATGDHPSTRLAHHQRPFTFVGLDYFGPYSVTVGRHHEKRYVALFTCLTTRAIHLEIAGSLSTDSAIMALRRMIARRGCPTEIHSDNGTNFRGADAELRKAAYGVTKDEAELRAIRWRFIPPGAPFMGGAWERMVQCVKRALAATLKAQHPSEEMLHTLLLEAEYVVNNRPLTPVSTSPEDVEALTPLHFILGGPARVPQPGCFENSDSDHGRRWRRTQRLADMFWARWVKEYLITILQIRRDPRGRGQMPQLGDLVLVVDGTLPRNSWPRGRVVATFPGKDGITRVVEVQTKAGVLRRPTKKIIVLLTGSVTSTLGGECAR